jgi:hypothetical protein
MIGGLRLRPGVDSGMKGGPHGRVGKGRVGDASLAPNEVVPCQAGEPDDVPHTTSA